MANKYINAKDLELEASHYLLCEKESETITLEELNEIANRFPTADVVEVVRCKDCKYYTESIYFAPEKMCYRYKDSEGNKIGYIKSDYDYCSYGERR